VCNGVHSRQRDRYTQADLGARIGTCGSYIAVIESVSTSARISEVEALATVFRTTAFDL
jgi:predicted transcriptional regulator